MATRTALERAEDVASGVVTKLADLMDEVERKQELIEELEEKQLELEDENNSLKDKLRSMIAVVEDS